MGIVALLVSCEVLGIALLKFTGIEDAYIILTMAAVIIGSFWKLKMEQQKIQAANERMKEEYEARIAEQSLRMAEIEKQLANKVDLTTCHIDHQESKKMFRSITDQMAKMNSKIEENHAEVLNTIIQLLHTKEDRIL